jgi:hypothetical protein
MSAIEKLIMDAKTISDDDKRNLLVKEVKYSISKGYIDKLAVYGNKIETVIDDIQPIITLKNCGGKMEEGGELDSDFIATIYENGGGVNNIESKRERVIDYYLNNEDLESFVEYYGVSEEVAENGGQELINAIISYHNLDKDENVIEKFNDLGLEEIDEFEKGGFLGGIFGGGRTYKKGLAYKLDRAKHNKSEDWEVPLKNRKYENGGKTDWYDFDKKMALINLNQIHEYAVKLDNIVTEETELEEWVKMKLTRVEQNVSDVKKSLEGWEKFEQFGEGGRIFKKQLLHISKYAKDLIAMIKLGSKLMSWQENKLAVSAEYIDAIYHHLDYKMGNRASDVMMFEEYEEYGNGGAIKTDFNELKNTELRNVLISFWNDFFNNHIGNYLSIEKENYVLSNIDNVFVIVRDEDKGNFSDFEKQNIDNFLSPYFDSNKKPLFSDFFNSYEIKDNKIIIYIKEGNMYYNGGGVGTEISKIELENMIGKELNGWNNDIVYYNGKKYQKCYLRPYYKVC